MAARKYPHATYLNHPAEYLGLFSGVYDYEFMDYTVRVLQKCKEFGFKIYMDPHQDLVSCFYSHFGTSHLDTHANF